MKRFFLVASRLITATDDRPVPVEGATWVQIAAEGIYNGHPTGPFELNLEVFTKIVENFRLHPSFELDAATGLGKSDVIAFDFSHASEEPAAMVAVVGAPAQSWAIDLEVRKGEQGVQLWALTRWLEPARSYVQQDKYQWTSVAIWPEAVHPVSGEDIGWYMSSIAFTNDPFIQGMTPIAAHRVGRRVGGVVKLSPEFLFEDLKFILGLPITSSMEEVLAALAPLRAATQPGAVPPLGVDVEMLVGSLKSLLQLPLLADAESVFAEVDKLMGLIAAEPPAPVTQIPSDQPAPETTAAFAAGAVHMLKDWIIRLARAAGVSFTQAELDDDVKLQVLAERVGTKILAEQDEAMDAKTALTAIATALGVSDADAAVAALTETLASMNALKSAMPSLAAIMDGQVTAQIDEEEEDVERVAAERGWGDDIKALARHQRSGGVKFTERDPNRIKTMTVATFTQELEEHARILAAKTTAKATFAAQFPTSRAPVAPDYMSQNFTGTPSPQSPGLQLVAGQNGGPPRVAPAAPVSPPAPLGGPQIDLDTIPGVNLVEKCEHIIRAEAQKTGAGLSYDQINAKAVMMARDLRPRLKAVR